MVLTRSVLVTSAIVSVAMLACSSASTHVAASGSQAASEGPAGGAEGSVAGASNSGGSVGGQVEAAGGAAVVMRPVDPCVAANSCAPGTWVNVTDPRIDLFNGDCGNYGTKSILVDPLNAAELYSSFNCGGIWKSKDYGLTWQGPINTGENGLKVSDCAGAISIARSPSNPLPILYESCIRGTGIGFWRSLNGGVDWKRFDVLPNGGQPTAVNQGFYTPAVDPYDANHLLMAGHQTDVLAQSIDGGETWTPVILDPGMVSGNTGTAGINFINTGVVSSTRNTWLWSAASVGVDQNGIGSVGTWRTTDGGATWKLVDRMEHINGSMHSELFQALPYSSGVLYLAGAYSALGAGVIRSEDFGATWVHVGETRQEAVVVGTPNHVYAMFGGGAGPKDSVDTALQVGGTTAVGKWNMPGTPAEMRLGPGQAAVTNNGTYNIVIMANYNSGLWRYVEPTN